MRYLLVCIVAVALVGCAGKSKPLVASATNNGPSEQQTSPGAASQEFAETPLQSQFSAEAGDRVFFDLDSHVLNAEARETLRRQAAWIGGRPRLRVLIAGNCDERGTREYNIALGARRAAAVRDALVSLGVRSDRIDTISYGKERPLDLAFNEAAWSRNRNAQTVLLSPTTSSR